MFKKNTCDFCQALKLSDVYIVPRSALGMVIAVCGNCGLTQSIQTKVKTSRKRVASTGSDAQFGNIRHSKGVRLQTAIAILDPYIKSDGTKRILDIGSNRGDFVQWASKTNPSLDIVGIEPDPTIVDEYKTGSNLTLHVAKLEDTDLPQQYFDFIYCSHTLEHADSAATMLKKIKECLKIGGYLFLEVPNLEVVGEPDIVEEFFVDKHRFHFNRDILCNYLRSLNFKTIYGGDSTDSSNITLVLKNEKGKRSNTIFKKTDLKLVKHNKKIIKNYRQTLESNRKKLQSVAEKLNVFMRRQKVAFWGGGRIFDALVRYGNLKTDRLCCVVDKYLSKYVNAVHTVSLKNPEYLKIAQPNVVVILARSSTDEIYQEAMKLGIRHIIKFSDLMTD